MLIGHGKTLAELGYGGFHLGFYALVVNVADNTDYHPGDRFHFLNPETTGGDRRCPQSDTAGGSGRQRIEWNGVI